MITFFIREKEKKIKEAWKIMGLTETAYYSAALL
jgi:hypothetical protein